MSESWNKLYLMSQNPLFENKQTNKQNKTAALK